jgi:hypothetical protein
MDSPTRGMGADAGYPTIPGGEDNASDDSKDSGSGAQHSTIVPMSDQAFRRRRAPVDPKVLTRRWLDGDSRIPQDLVAIVTSAPPSNIFTWDTRVMKEVLIAMEVPLISYTNPKCVEAMMALFFPMVPPLQDETPVLSRSASAEPEQDLPSFSGRQPPVGSLFADAGALLLPGAGAPSAASHSSSQLQQHKVEMQSIIADHWTSMRAEMKAFRDDVRQDFLESTRGREGRGPVAPSGMPAAKDMFEAVAYAARHEDPMTDELASGSNEQAEGQGWAFYPSASGGPLTAQRVSAPSVQVHSRKGGSENLYTQTAEKFHPFERFMRTNMAAWPHFGLAREAITHAVALDRLALLPKDLDSNKALHDTREVLVRRWLCLKWVAGRTSQKSTPSFPTYATGFESLLTKQDLVPAAAITTALANAKFQAKVLKAQSEQ